MDPVQHAWNVHAAVQDWSKQAETKASFLLTIESALLVYFGGRVPKLNQDDLTPDEFYWIQIAMFCGLAVLAGAVYQLVVVVYPRLRGKQLAAESWNNAIYFGHLMHQSPAAIENTLRRRDALPQLAKQLQVTSKIAWAKHRRLKRSIQFSGISLGLLIGSYAAAAVLGLNGTA